MKRNVNFSRGEWMAALTLLALIIVSYGVYSMCDFSRGVTNNCGTYVKVIDEFNRKQSEIADSIEEISALRYERSWRFESSVNDTNPKWTSSKSGKMYEIVKLDINHCDTSDIVVVPQFGSKRAAKLVEYRDKLGGYYSLEQLKEVYILQNIDVALLEKYFYVRKEDVKKININTASYKEISAHPYFDAYMTKIILNYRNKNGKISSMKELQQITHAYPELIERLQPYISF